MNNSTHLPTVTSEELGEFRAFMMEERSRRIHPAAQWTIVVTLVLTCFSGIWIASETYHEVASLRTTINKWEPKIDQITALGDLRDRLDQQQSQLASQQAQIETLRQSGRSR